VTATVSDLELKKSVQAALRDRYMREFDQAIKIAQDSGLPGPSDGPQDALRHIMGSALLTERWGPLPVRIITFLYEMKPGLTSEGFQGDRFLMDVHNNYLGMNLWLMHRSIGQVQRAAVEIIGRGSFAGGSAERPRAVGLGESSEMRATWLESRVDRVDLPNARDRDEADRRQREETAEREKMQREKAEKDRAEREKAEREKAEQEKAQKEKDEKEEEDRRQKEEDKKDDEPEVSPLTRPTPEGAPEPPTTMRELREIFLKMGTSEERVRLLIDLDSNLTSADLSSILAEAAKRRVVADSIVAAAFGADTSDEAEERVLEWLRGRALGWLTGRLIDPRIEDPARDGRRNISTTRT
jgi:hypothetical protein